MVIVDTTVWIDYLTGVRNSETDWLDRELDQQRLGLTDLILCEVLQGIRDDASFGRALREFRRFEIFETGGTELLLRRRGIIATCADAVTRSAKPLTAGLRLSAFGSAIPCYTGTETSRRSSPRWAWW